MKNKYPQTIWKIIILRKEIGKKLKKILKDEGLNLNEWLENAVEDYDS